MVDCQADAGPSNGLNVPGVESLAPRDLRGQRGICVDMIRPAHQSCHSQLGLLSTNAIGSGRRLSRWDYGRAKSLVIAVAVVSFSLPPAGFAQPKSSNIDAVSRQLSGQAAKGQFDGNAAYDALRKAGMSHQDASDAVDRLRDISGKVNNDKTGKDSDAAAKKKKEEDAKKGADQNASGTGDWNFGQVYRDRDYKVAYPLTNNCKVAQTVTITYPKGFPLTGPTSVEVPAKTTIDVAMVLQNTSLGPIPIPPWPPGVTFSCYDLKDDIALVHPKVEKITNTSSGKLTWVCEEMKRTHHITMHVHMHGPPAPDPPAGGGGGPKKRKPVCTTYWNYGEFYPNVTTHAPEQCRDDVRDQAHEYFGTGLQSLRAKDPQAWEWVPTANAIDRMSAADLLSLKARADVQARSER